MKTQNTKLIFEKSSITELNDGSLQDINGGSTGELCDHVHAASYAVSQAAVHVVKIEIAISFAVLDAIFD